MQFLIVSLQDVVGLIFLNRQLVSEGAEDVDEIVCLCILVVAEEKRRGNLLGAPFKSCFDNGACKNLNPG